MPAWAGFETWSSLNKEAGHLAKAVKQGKVQWLTMTVDRQRQPNRKNAVLNSDINK